MEMSPLNRIQFRHCIRKSYSPPPKIYCYSEAKQVSDHAATLTCVSGKSNTHQQLDSEAGHLKGVPSFLSFYTEFGNRWEISVTVGTSRGVAAVTGRFEIQTHRENMVS
jgi:hypothetical protein